MVKGEQAKVRGSSPNWIKELPLDGLEIGSTGDEGNEVIYRAEATLAQQKRKGSER